MRLAVVQVVVKKSYEAKKATTVDLLVDSGAVYSVVDATILRRLGCRPHRRKSFFLADGTAIVRPVGDAYFEYAGIGGAAPVIFGEKGDSNLLGATALEALELVLDPFKRELRPMTTTLMGAGEETDLERRKRLQDEVIASIKNFRAGDRLTREEIHDRAAVR